MCIRDSLSTLPACANAAKWRTAWSGTACCAVWRLSLIHISALAFRIFKALLEKKYGKDGAKGRIYATTDKARGTLKDVYKRQSPL